MGDLTKNISRSELKCSCGTGCGYDGLDFETVTILQDTCDHFAKELGVPKVVCTITSAARCPTHNRKPVAEGGAGSSSGSKHERCTAVDFRIKGVDNMAIYNYLDAKYPDRLGLATKLANPSRGTKGFVHLDSDVRKRRWSY